MSKLNIDEIISKITNIEGFLWDDEAILLAQMVEKTYNLFNKDLTIVEVGSYCGRSTVAIGLAVKAICPRSAFYAIDPHEGQLFFVGETTPRQPTWERFHANIAKNGLLETVDAFVMKSYEFQTDEPIHLLFIDGLHDYKNVSRDFHHFENLVEPSGFVILHDYYIYPDVTRFVDEILTSTVYERVDLVKSSIVLQKQESSKGK